MATVLRIVIVYGFILIGLRVLGKREFSQLSATELIMLILIPETVSPALTHNDYSLTTGLIAVSTILVLTFLTSLVIQGSQRAERLITGQATVLLAHGALIPDAMNRERVTTDEIQGEMHKSGLERIEQVRWAILESDGRIAIIPEEEPPTQTEAARGKKQDMEPKTV